MAVPPEEPAKKEKEDVTLLPKTIESSKGILARFFARRRPSSIQEMNSVELSHYYTLVDFLVMVVRHGEENLESYFRCKKSMYPLVYAEVFTVVAEGLWKDVNIDTFHKVMADGKFSFSPESSDAFLKRILAPRVVNPAIVLGVTVKIAAQYGLDPEVNAAKARGCRRCIRQV